MAEISSPATLSGVSAVQAAPARLISASAACAGLSATGATAALIRVVAARLSSLSAIVARRLGAQEASVLVQSYSEIAALPLALPPGLTASGCNVVVLEPGNRIVIAECC